jgi:hypothetical protein
MGLLSVKVTERDELGAFVRGEGLGKRIRGGEGRRKLPDL